MIMIEISGGRIIDPANHIDKIGSVFIVDGKIASLSTAPAGFNAELNINARGRIVCPGFIDLNARLREPGQSQKATIQSETRAAASAGFTTLCLPPDTVPVIDTPAVTELIHDKAFHAGYARVLPIAALTQNLQGKDLSAMFTLKQAGCIAVSNAEQPLANLHILRRAMEYAASHELLLVYRPQDYSLSNSGCAHEGHVATRFGLPGIPAAAETVAMAQCLELVEQTGCKVHFSQLSCARSITLLQQAKNRLLPVSADVAMHQLFLMEEDMLPFDSRYHVLPPLRSRQDRDALKEALGNGIIDAICSAHQPHDIDAKLGAFPETEAGIASLETLLPLLLQLVAGKVLDLAQGISVLTRNPAGILNLDSGTLTLGAPADVCIFDPAQHWLIDKDSWQSNGVNTPFWGQRMQGRVTWTLQQGRIIHSLNSGA